MLDLRFSDAELERHREHITGFVRDRVDAAGVDGAVLGLSGGIDSTLTAYLTAEALGSENLHGLVLPATVSGDENMSDAERVARDLEISYDVLEIEPVVDSLLAVYPEAEGDREAVGNARARVRAVLNYLVANHERRLVIGTGNRSEAAVGYFTKYGDGAVDCHPIGNLYKKQVRQLARHVGVPADLATKTPTAELWADQTDEEEMGIGYDTLDSILATHIDGPLSVAATCRALEVDAETVEQVRRMHDRSEHKRTVPPAPEPIE
ncbi:NAD+ synthase [Natrarchaeobius halalkaliphilus]|uniref:NH(3)-dependent NAD(+) synthetase n=1 Tax=Natrarchaeobius halalkaliphilus TaxID=1679091 RepID=A0A3N6N3M7_9EURY|nr:NAD+ synthase [Natrarchaeobius halalkaliphilus]RQG92732.1 NAD+ synthase [Natrarchaeobius halalkaliphilus]